MRKAILYIMLSALCQTAFCQSATDTAALVKEFRKVMNFATQPYLHYTTVTQMQAQPVIEAADTATTQGVFYKNQTNIYYLNGAEEIYLEDSLLVRINNNRKTIWLSKVDMASKEKMNSSPVSSKQFTELMRKKYTIQKSATNNRNGFLRFESKENTGISSAVSTIIGLEYDEKNYLPRNIQVSISMQQPATDEMISSIKNQGIEENKLIQLINEKKWLVRSQTAITTFKSISNKKESVLQMPSYKQILDFNIIEQIYTAKGKYSEYELTKTF
jgi:hypothetical protein